MTLGVCLALAASVGGASSFNKTEPVFVPTKSFTLAWTHSIEKVRWEEDYRVVVTRTGDTLRPVLHSVASRVKGSAAGMEPAPGSVLKDGWYMYTPSQTEHERLRLTRSAYTEDYELCVNGKCKKMSDYIKSDGWVTELYACQSHKPGH